jgi:cystathionine beta-lyase family protein involved in aluminum resistance
MLIQCAKSIKDSTATTSKTAQELNKTVETELGNRNTQVFNNSKSYLLAYREKELTETFTSYIIIETKTGEVTKKGTFVPGYIKWVDDHSLELLSAPGIIPQGRSLSDYKKIITLNQ